MNLHRIVSGAIGAVNPFVLGTIQFNLGTYTTAADGKRTPDYRTLPNVSMQVQPLSYQDIIKLDALNIQGYRRKIYIKGKIDGLVRADSKGGDLITLPDKTVWLVAMVLEQWPDWVSVAVTLQNGA